VRYISTRDRRPQPRTVSFEEVLLTGLADDGGLYVPDHLPPLDPDKLDEVARWPYAKVASHILGLFAGDAFAKHELDRFAEQAYRGFRHAAVTPLVQLDHGLWLLELFHGPTLAFKDLALQLLGLLFEAALARKNEHLTIIGATSGDTGSAALDACRNREGIDIFIFYPHGRVSEVQRRQMTTCVSTNAHAIAVEGTFDDCQDLVKALFTDEQLCEDLNLAAINSINWARIAAQTVYYFAAATALGASDRKVAFSVPTGNFGNVYAGHIARGMGLPIERLVIGTNRNDILARYIGTGDMTLAPVEPSLSPSMDIQVSSNFERLLFELKGRSGVEVSEAIAQFRRTGILPRAEREWRAAQGLFSAHGVDDATTVQIIADTYRRSGILIDPHTAVAVGAARAELEVRRGAAPMVALASAHPAKFPDAVERATGIRPALPAALADLFERRERITILPKDQDAVTRYLHSHVRRSKRAA
jgi:threonine synthase